jgi:hypothetical protein
MSERGRPRKASARRNMTLRLPTGLFERIEAHQAQLEALAGGVGIARHDVLLMLLTKGLDALDPPSPALSLPAMAPVSPPSALPQESVGSEPPCDPAVSPAAPAPTGADTPADSGRAPGPFRGLARGGDSRLCTGPASSR